MGLFQPRAGCDWPGKYIKLQYGANWRLVGARTLPFLLEKSRLVHQEQNERNYHVFYQLCKGVSRVSVLAKAGGAVVLVCIHTFVCVRNVGQLGQPRIGSGGPTLGVEEDETGGPCSLFRTASASDLPLGSLSPRRFQLLFLVT